MKKQIDIKQLLSYTLKGGALYIALMVGIVICILLAMLMVLARFNTKQVTEFAQNSQLYSNLNSALELARSKYFTDVINSKWIKNEGNDDSIKITRKYWGAYLLIYTETKNRHHSLSYAGLYGSPMSSDTALVVKDNGRPVGLSGNIIFKANCYLPAGSIKPAFIEGQSYSESGMNQSYVKQAPAQLPMIEASFVNGVEEQQENPVYARDSLYELSNDLSRSFSKSTLVVKTSGILSHLKLKNNIKIISYDNLSIDSSCHLENVLIIARKVHFKTGFRGCVHVIASDSIIADKESVFDFPSSFVLKPFKKIEGSLKCIIMGENSIFNGGIIALSSAGQSNPDVLVKLHSTSEVNGSIYTSGFLHIEGKLNANVFCERLLLKTASAVYENHMLTSEFDPGKYAHLLSIPFLWNEHNSIILSKNLGS